MSSPASSSSSASSITPSAHRHYRVTRAELPLSCPTPEMSLWNAHPRVWLPLDQQGGHARCPYCSAEYSLVD